MGTGPCRGCCRENCRVFFAGLAADLVSPTRESTGTTVAHPRADGTPWALPRNAAAYCGHSRGHCHEIVKSGVPVHHKRSRRPQDSKSVWGLPTVSAAVTSVVVVSPSIAPPVIRRRTCFLRHHILRPFRDARASEKQATRKTPRRIITATVGYCTCPRVVSDIFCYMCTVVPPVIAAHSVYRRVCAPNILHPSRHCIWRTNPKKGASESGLYEAHHHDQSRRQYTTSPGWGLSPAASAAAVCAAVPSVTASRTIYIYTSTYCQNSGSLLKTCSYDVYFILYKYR